MEHTWENNGHWKETCASYICSVFRLYWRECKAFIEHKERSCTFKKMYKRLLFFLQNKYSSSVTLLTTIHIIMLLSWLENNCCEWSIKIQIIFINVIQEMKYERKNTWTFSYIFEGSCIALWVKPFKFYKKIVYTKKQKKKAGSPCLLDGSVAHAVVFKSTHIRWNCSCTLLCLLLFVVWPRPFVVVFNSSAC